MPLEPSEQPVISLSTFVRTSLGTFSSTPTLEVRDAPVQETEVGASGLEVLVKRAVSGRQPADSLFECGVLGGDPLDGLLDPLNLQVPDLAGEFADAGSLGEDVGVSGLERVRGVQRAYWPGRRALAVVVSEQLGPALAGLGHGGGDRGFGIQVFVEECAGDVRAAGDGAGRVGEVGGAEGGGPHSMEAVLGFAQVQGEDAGEEAEPARAFSRPSMARAVGSK